MRPTISASSSTSSPPADRLKLLEAGTGAKVLGRRGLAAERRIRVRLRRVEEERKEVER
jgi:hypothetical protein